MKKILNIYVLLLVFIFVLFIGMGCNQKGQSLGSVRNVVVLADSLLWEQVGTHIKTVLSKEKYTPQPEMIFVLNRVDPAKIGNLKKYPQILLIGTLDQEGVTKDLLDQLLPLNSRGRQLVENDERFFFPVKDPWSREQLLGVVVSKDLPTLKENLELNKKTIFEAFDDHINNRVLQQVYYSDEQKEIENEFMSKFGWSIRVPHDYFIAMDSSDARFIWLRRSGPKRLLRDLFVYWEPVNDPSILSKEWVLETRTNLTNKYYQGDYVYTDNLISVEEEIVNFQNRYAIKLEGIWQNDSLSIGGPFRSYAFYNEGDGRLYLLDGSVWAPEQRKWPYLRQLDLIVHTFTTKADLNKKE